MSLGQDSFFWETAVYLSSVVPTPLTEKTIVPLLNCFCTLVKNHLSILMWVYSGPSVLFHRSLWLSLCQHISVNYYTFILSLMFVPLFFFFKSVLAIPVCLPFYINLSRLLFINNKRILLGFLLELYEMYVITWGQIDILCRVFPSMNMV